MRVEATDPRQSLVDCQSKTERGPNMDVDQIAFRYQDSVRVIDAIHSALADHQTMNIQHQDPQDHTASQKQCGFSPCAMVAMVAMVAMEAMLKVVDKL
ncbi:hypothetical protein NHJ6243_002767 [Beauveria neobassiana]